MATTPKPPIRPMRPGADVFPAPGALSLAEQVKRSETPSEAADAAQRGRSLLALLAQQLLRGYVLPPGAEEITMQGEQDIAAAGIIALPNNLIVPEGEEVWITFVQFLSTVVDSTIGASTFSVRLNAAPIQGYSGLAIFQGGGSQSLGLDAKIHATDGQALDVIYNAANATARHVGYLLRGYRMPKGADSGK